MSLTEVDSGFLSGSALLGITSSCVSGELILSRENGQIQVYNMDGRCCVKSWQLSSSQTLSCPVVQHPTSRTYWAVNNNTELLTWRFSDTSLNQLPQGLPSPVHALLVTPGNKAPVAVLRDGLVCLVGKRMEAIKNRKKRVVKFADVCAVDRVCVVCSCEDVTYVDVWAVSSEGLSHVTDVSFDTSGLSGFCICRNTLIATDSKGGLHSWALTNQMESLSTTSSSPIGSQIVAVSHDGFVTCNAHALLLWEPSYMTVQCEVQAVVTKLFSCDGWVCDGVRVWRVEGVKSGLAGALGKASAQTAASVLSWDTQGSQGDTALAKLLDREQTPTLQCFMSVFSACTLTSDLCYSELLDRLMDESVFWAPEALAVLMKEGVITLSHSDGLLQKICSHKDWDLLVTCLECVGGYSESVIVECVELLLSSSDVISAEAHGQLIQLLLCQPFNDALLQQPLSQLKDATVRDLLQFISGHLSTFQLMVCPTATYNALLDWAGQIIDVHITRLTFDPIARDILVHLQKAVRDQVTCWNRLSVVRGVTGAWSAMDSAPKANGWLYRVETMDIDF